MFFCSFVFRFNIEQYNTENIVDDNGSGGYASGDYASGSGSDSEDMGHVTRRNKPHSPASSVTEFEDDV